MEFAMFNLEIPIPKQAISIPNKHKPQRNENYQKSFIETILFQKKKNNIKRIFNNFLEHFKFYWRIRRKFFNRMEVK